MSSTRSSQCQNINDVTFWIYQCNLYLFLAKVYKIKHITKPEINGDALEYIEKLSKITKMTQKGQGSTKKLLLVGPMSNFSNNYCEYDLNISFPESELNEISQTIIKINNDDWDDVDVNGIEKSQAILLKILKKIKAEVKAVQFSS